MATYHPADPVRKRCRSSQCLHSAHGATHTGENLVQTQMILPGEKGSQQSRDGSLVFSIGTFVKTSRRVCKKDSSGLYQI